MYETFPRTCVAPSGEFIYGIHKPRLKALNLRNHDDILTLGYTSDGEAIDNAVNFPEDHVDVVSSSWIIEIPNPMPFMGATFIIKSTADQTAGGHNPFNRENGHSHNAAFEPSDEIDLSGLPRQSLLVLAKISTDPELLAKLAENSCRFTRDERTGTVAGRIYEEVEPGDSRPVILDRNLFQLVSNNQFLPDQYKRQMVLNPGVQGKSPIVGEFFGETTHIWEYLRENSYIPGGHYAANMAHNAVRYRLRSLTKADIGGLRHLYYQRIYVQLAEQLGMSVKAKRRTLGVDELENLRFSLLREIGLRNRTGDKLPFNSVIWGQNFGFDLSTSGYRLGASHQQVHQQFALVPSRVCAFTGGENESSITAMPAYSQTDLIAQFAREYRERTGESFFKTYLKAIQNNKRLDGRADKESDLIFYQDENVICFVPKAQRSQGEVQIMTKKRCGNIIEADTQTRNSLDQAILLTMKALENLGVEMLTGLELSKKLDSSDGDQRILYCFLPRHPRSPGGFSEFQQRWIINHYPEDFARVCRDEVVKIEEKGR